MEKEDLKLLDNYDTGRKGFIIMEGKQFQRTEDGHLILMTPEERKLLITDLTARIQYGVICLIERVDDFGPRFRNEKLTGYNEEENGCFYFDFCYGLSVSFTEKVKPYLRPMSSMTDEEYNEYKSFECDTIYEDGKLVSNGCGDDWLNAHHFDYRGLIEKGLALEAPKNIYNF